jgi:hypothetical protein
MSITGPQLHARWLVSENKFIDTVFGILLTRNMRTDGKARSGGIYYLFSGTLLKLANPARPVLRKHRRVEKRTLVSFMTSTRRHSSRIVLKIVPSRLVVWLSAADFDGVPFRTPGCDFSSRLIFVILGVLVG